MVYNFLDIDEKNIEKSTYIRLECPYSVFEHLCSVSKQKPCDYPPWILREEKYLFCDHA